MSALITAMTWAVLGWAPGAAPAPQTTAELERLQGHTVEVAPGGDQYIIVDVAGEGRPQVGIVERRGTELWLVGAGPGVRLVGPLAVPRIAGPGYKVWVIGERHGQTLRARRLGVLAPPLPR